MSDCILFSHALTNYIKDVWHYLDSYLVQQNADCLSEEEFMYVNNRYQSQWHKYLYDLSCSSQDLARTILEDVDILRNNLPYSKQNNTFVTTSSRKRYDRYWIGWGI